MATALKETKDLAAFERERLAELEQVIDGGAQAFISVGMALLEIRDSRLYREDFATFEDYCQKKWGFSRNYGHKLVRSANVATRLLENGDSESPKIGYRAALALGSAADPVAAWNEAREQAPGGRPTAKQIRSIVMDRRDAGRTEKFAIPPEIMDAVNATLASPDTVVLGADGLDADWTGRVFVLPAPNQRAERIISAMAYRLESDYGRYDEAVAILPASTGAQWFHDTRRPIAFLPAHATLGCSMVAIYYGECTDDFYDAFARVGKLYAPVPSPGLRRAA